MAPVVAVFVGALFVTEAIVAAIIVTLEIVAAVWVAYATGALEFVLGLFGVKDEDVIQTQVTTQRIIPDDTDIRTLIVKVALENQKDDSIGIMDRILGHAGVTRGRYNKYFQYGKDSFVHGLPESSLKAVVVDSSLVKTTIDAQYGIGCTIITSRIGTLTKDEYVYATFYDSYGYTPYNNEMSYLGDVFKITNIDYNFTLDRYDVYLSSYQDVVTTVVTTTTKTVTNIDATTDNVHTVVSEHLTKVGSKSGLFVDTTIEVSVTDVVIPKDSVIGSTTVGTVTSTEIDAVYNTTTINVPAYLPSRYYIVKYWYVDDSEWYYWIYEEDSGGHPALDNSNYYVKNLDMMPIVAIRNSGVNINANKESDLYKQTVDMLQYVGLDLDTFTDGITSNPDAGSIEDAFIHFGINPSDTSEVISKMLFLMFDYTFSDTSLTEHSANTKAYLSTISEGPFNQALAWSSQTRTVKAGIIGTLGKYAHSVAGDVLTIQYQAQPEFYVELVLVGMSSLTLVDRQGLTGGVSKNIGDAGFYISISHYFIDSMSPLEQYELFTKTLIVSIYAAQVSHLEWYETAAFANLIKIAAIVYAIWSLGSSLAAASAAEAAAAAAGTVATTTVSGVLMNAALMAAVMFGASILLQQVMQGTDSVFVRVVAAAVMAYVVGGGFNTETMSFVSPEVLTSTVTNFAMAVGSFANGLNMMFAADMEKLQGEQNVFQAKVNDVTAEQEKKLESITSLLDTEYVAELQAIQPVEAYLAGPDAMMYKAIQMQYNYNSLFDYDRLTSDFVNNKLRLGVI